MAATLSNSAKSCGGEQRTNPCFGLRAHAAYDIGGRGAGRPRLRFRDPEQFILELGIPLEENAAPVIHRERLSVQFRLLPEQGLQYARELFRPGDSGNIGS